MPESSTQIQNSAALKNESFLKLTRIFDYQHILRTMDLMAENYDDYIAYLFHASNKVVKRNTAVCYYDCTNYYCEAESADEDYTDPITGEVLTGLRQYGLAKDHKPNPLVEMGLFMDTNGIPISMCITPGNANEQTTVLPLEKELIRMFGDKRTNSFTVPMPGLVPITSAATMRWAAELSSLRSPSRNFPTNSKRLFSMISNTNFFPMRLPFPLKP